MRYEVVISKSGSVTIPVALRNELGIQPGQVVTQSIKRNKIILEFGKRTEKTGRTGLRKEK